MPRIPTTRSIIFITTTIPILQIKTTGQILSLMMSSKVDSATATQEVQPVATRRTTLASELQRLTPSHTFNSEE
jgi:hypothetical protein